MRQSMPGHGRRHASHESVKYRCGSSLAHIWDWTCYKTRGNVSICKWSVGGKSQMWLWLEFRASGGGLRRQGGTTGDICCARVLRTFWPEIVRILEKNRVSENPQIRPPVETLVRGL